MSKKDLFRIVIRLFGVYLALQFLYAVPQTVMSLYFDSEIESVLIVLTMLISFLAVALFLIFRADAIISLFRLDKGLDSENMEVPESFGPSVTKIGITLIALFFIFSAIPGILFQLYVIFRASIAEPTLGMLDSSISLYSPNYPQLIQEVLSALAGYFLISYSGKLTEWIQKS